MGELAKWRAEKWVRIGTDGSIKGECGTSKNKKTPAAKIKSEKKTIKKEEPKIEEIKQPEQTPESSEPVLEVLQPQFILLKKDIL